MQLAETEGAELEGKGPGRRGKRGRRSGKGGGERNRSLWSDAWHDLSRNPVFIIAGLLIVFLVLISLWPQLIAGRDPLSCNLGRSLSPSSSGHWFGFDTQGCDVYTRVVYSQ